MNDLLTLRDKFKNEFKQTYNDLKKLFRDRGLYNGKNPIAALQFAATYSNGTETYDIDTLTIAHKKYLSILSGFLKEHGSILFSGDSKQIKEKFTPLDGLKLEFDFNKPKWVTYRNLSKDRDAPYSTWIQFLKTEQFGKYSIWISITDKLSDPWTFSIDYFLILNFDISHHLPLAHRDFLKIRKADELSRNNGTELVKWQLRESIILIIYRFIEDYGIGLISNTLALNAREQATRAAISQVMARNMSHNLGSHVLNNLTEKLPKEKANKYTSKAYSSTEALPLKHLAIVYQLLTFNNYIKCRMDYLSDVTFGIPTMQTSKKIYGEVFKELDETRLLLDYISGLAENFEFSIHFLLDGAPLSSSNDAAIAMPNDLLGCQALYNILENIIRNTAKHNQDKQRKTKFLVNFKTELPLPKHVSEEVKSLASTMYTVTISDDIVIDGNKKFTGADETLKKKYMEFVLKTENDLFSESIQVSKIDWLVFCQNYRLNLRALDENNKLRSSALGLLEMSASAAYLRKLDVINIDEKEFLINHDPQQYNTSNNLNILKAFNDNGRLAYRFFIKKPTEFLFIGLDIDHARREILYREGISIITRSEFVRRVIEGKVFHHLFLIYTFDPGLKNLIRKYQVQLPNRVIDINYEHSSLVKVVFDPNATFQQIERRVWRIWFEKKKGRFSMIKAFSNFTSENDVDNNAYVIVLLNHYDYWEDIIPFKNKGVQYIEPLTSIAQRLLPDYKGPLSDYIDSKLKAGSSGETLLYKIYDSCITKILAVDERIQSYASGMEQSDESAIPCQSIFENSNIKIPHKDEVDLYERNFDATQIQKAESFINKHVEQYQFLVIHYSILERMHESYPEQIGKQLITWSKKTRVIVTSGRGKPKTLPKEVCYINLSPVLKAFTQTRNKYEITHLLNQARN